MITLLLIHFYTSRMIARVPGWWSGCALRIPRILSAHREALTPVLVSRTPQGTSGFCSKRSTSLRCCSRWGSWRGCRGWRQLWRGRTCWTTWFTLRLHLFSDQNGPKPVPIWAKIARNPSPSSCPCPPSWVLGLTAYQAPSSSRPCRVNFSTVAFLNWDASSLFSHQPLFLSGGFGRHCNVVNSNQVSRSR